MLRCSNFSVLVSSFSVAQYCPLACSVLCHGHLFVWPSLKPYVCFWRTTLGPINKERSVAFYLWCSVFTAKRKRIAKFLRSEWRSCSHPFLCSHAVLKRNYGNESTLPSKKKWSWMFPFLCIWGVRKLILSGSLKQNAGCCVDCRWAKAG